MRACDVQLPTSLTSLITKISMHHSKRNSFQYRSDIDGLRAIAVICVIIFHAFPGLMRGGFIGVDLFFVISGYLITKIIVNDVNTGSFMFLEFYSKRIKRIVPALLLVLVSTYLVGIFVLLPVEINQLGSHIGSGALFFSNFRLWEEVGYFDRVAETKPLLHLWSLSVEEQFYILWPVIVWFAYKNNKNLLLVAIAISIFSFCANIALLQSDPPGAFYAPQSRMWELIFGALFATKELSLYKNNMLSASSLKTLSARRLSLCNILSMLGFLLLVIGLFCIDKSREYPGIWAVLPVLSATLIITAGPFAWINRRILSNKFLVYVGLISFPLYLWHWPLLSFAYIIESGTPSRFSRLLIVIVSFALAWLTYAYVEKPIRNSKIPNRNITLLLVMATISLGLYSAAKFDRHARSFDYDFNGSWEMVDSYCKKQWQPKGDLCRIIDQDAPQVIVLGDSHAYRLFLGLQEMSLHGLLKKNVMLYGQTGCPYPSAANTDCRLVYDDVFTIIDSSNNIESIVLSSRSINSYISERSGGSTNIGDYKIQLDSVLENLAESKKRIFFLIDNPQLDFNPKQCEARPVKFYGKHLDKKCAIQKDQYIKEDGSYRAAVYEVVNKYPNISVIDSADVFCDENECIAVLDGKVLYDDPTHLSIYGSFFLSKFIVSKMLKE